MPRLRVGRRRSNRATGAKDLRSLIGYNHAASLIERMERDGVVSSPNHKGVREVLLPDNER